MNERIRELSRQTDAVVITMMTGNKQYTFLESDLEKFAELLIRECARVADIADENKCEWIGGNILTHFGVKE